MAIPTLAALVRDDITSSAGARWPISHRAPAEEVMSSRTSAASVGIAMSAPRLRSAYDIVNGVRIHSLVSPGPSDQPTIVFVHGLGVSTRYMEPTMVRLAERFAVAGLDFPGFCQSGNSSHILDVP